MKNINNMIKKFILNYGNFDKIITENTNEFIVNHTEFKPIKLFKFMNKIDHKFSFKMDYKENKTTFKKIIDG